MHLLLSTVFYLAYMGILFYFAVKSPMYSQKKEKNCLIVFISIIVLFFFFKKFGLDYIPYVEWYTELPEVYNYRLEPIPYIMMYIPKQLGLPHNFFFMIIGFTTIFINYIIIVNKTNKRLLALFILFYLLFMSAFSDAMRQALAASFFIYSIYMISEKKTVKSLFFIILSLLSHYSSVIILPVLIFLNLFKKIKWSLSIYNILITITIGLSVILQELIQNIVAMIDINGNILLFKLVYYVEHYQEYGYQYLNMMHKILWYSLMIFPLFGYLLLNYFIIKIKAFKRMDKFYHTLFLLNIMGSLSFIFFFFLDLYTIAGRISLTLSFGSYMLWVFIFENYKLKKVFKFFLLHYLIFNIIVLIYYMQPFSDKSPFYFL